MRSFSSYRLRQQSPLKQAALPILTTLTVLAMLFWALGDISTQTDEERLAGTERAINRAVILSYAVEGQFPPSINYLKENYGLIVDTEKYIIHYQFMGGNFMPNVIVLPRDFDEDYFGEGWE